MTSCKFIFAFFLLSMSAFAQTDTLLEKIIDRALKLPKDAWHYNDSTGFDGLRARIYFDQRLPDDPSKSISWDGIDIHLKGSTHGMSEILMSFEDLELYRFTADKPIPELAPLSDIFWEIADRLRRRQNAEFQAERDRRQAVIKIVKQNAAQRFR